jgi:hypothetical protein
MVSKTAITAKLKYLKALSFYWGYKKWNRE